MNLKKIERNILSVVFLLFVSFFIYKSFAYSYLDRRMVLFFGIPAFILLVLLLLADNIPKLSGLHIRARFFSDRVEKREPRTDDVKQAESIKAKQDGQAWYVFLSLFVFFLMIAFLGFLIAIPIYTLLYLKFFSKESWMMSIVLTAGLWAIVYFGFAMLLGLHF